MGHSHSTRETPRGRIAHLGSPADPLHTSFDILAEQVFNTTHPGEVIKDELLSRGIPQKEFAERTGIPYTMLNDILNERRALSAMTSLLIESALGISAELLMGLQSDYTMKHVRNSTEMKQKLLAVKPYTTSASPVLHKLPSTAIILG